VGYAVQQDIIDRYGQQEFLLVADRDGDGNADSGVVATAIDDATDEINVYLASNYVLPLVNVPSILVRLCVDVVMYRLATNAGSLTDEKKERYKSAITLLEKIGSGKVSLGIESPPEMQQLSASYVDPYKKSNDFSGAL
jgi:phage gp36-like protein